MEKINYLYMITNETNGKQYIGVSVNPKRRFKCYHMNSKYGSPEISKDLGDTFTLKILVGGKESFMYELESKAIAHFNTLVPNGYNRSKGGMGGSCKGQVNGRAILSEEEVKKIREIYDAGYTQGEIADAFGISRTNVGSIVRGETWPDAGGPISRGGRKGRRYWT